MKPSIKRLIKIDGMLEEMNKNRAFFQEQLEDEVKQIINFKDVIGVNYIYKGKDLILEIILPVLAFGLFPDSVSKFGEEEMRMVEEYYHVIFERNMSFENLDGTHWRFRSI